MCLNHTEGQGLEKKERSIVKPAPLPERERPVSKRKNTKDWCKGKLGRKHKPVKRHSDQLLQFKLADCREYVERITKWRHVARTCLHQEVCATCGKILTQFVRIEECPDLNDLE